MKFKEQVLFHNVLGFGGAFPSRWSTSPFSSSASDPNRPGFACQHWPSSSPLSVGQACYSLSFFRVSKKFRDVLCLPIVLSKLVLLSYFALEKFWSVKLILLAIITLTVGPKTSSEAPFLGLESLWKPLNPHYRSSLQILIAQPVSDRLPHCLRFMRPKPRLWEVRTRWGWKSQASAKV